MEENSDPSTVEEPPPLEPDLETIRNLRFELNGGSEPFRPIRFGEKDYQGRSYRKNLDSGVILRRVGDGLYECVVHEAPAESLMVSREVIPTVRQSNGQNYIRCEKVFYCTKCGETPPNQRLPLIEERELRQHTN